MNNIFSLIGAVVLAIVGYTLYKRYKDNQAEQQAALAAALQHTEPPKPLTSGNPKTIIPFSPPATPLTPVDKVVVTGNGFLSGKPMPGH